MFDYKPKKAVYDDKWTVDVGYLPLEFEPLEPDPKYTFNPRPMPSKDAWPIVVPKTAPPIGRLPDLIERMVQSMWKFAEPKAGTARGNVMMGTRGANPNDVSINATYHAQVRPTTPVISTTHLNKDAIASDWKVFEQLERTNAVTFRGDTRSPLAVITKAHGFGPPNSRTDRWYLENNVFAAFESYLKRRYQIPLLKADFLHAVDATAPTDADKKLLVDYLMWRKINEGESMHLGRMVENEAMKGYISTARSIDTSISFGTAYNSKPGWLYLVVVHGGFIVPFGKKTLWGTEEAEVAQWGPIPAERIVGFRHLERFEPDGPVFIRKTFRKSEPKAFEYLFKVMSGMVP